MFKCRFLLYFFVFFIAFSHPLSAQDAFDDFGGEYSKVINQSWDPLEPYNRSMTSFNDSFYINILGPVTKGYKKIVPEGLRKGASNFFANLSFPMHFINNLLQFKFNNAFEESMRFTINSTFGIGGLIDVAKTEGNLEPHPEDFGQTLGYYGVGNDIHIVWPFLGPSNLRDSIGKVVDSFTSLTDYDYDKDQEVIKNTGTLYGLKAYDILNEYSFQVDNYEALRSDALDLYGLLKSTYEQRRAKEIKE